MTTEQSTKYVFTYTRTHKRHYRTAGSVVISKSEVSVIAPDEDTALEKAKAASASVEAGDLYLFDIQSIKEIL